MSAARRSGSRSRSRSRSRSGAAGERGGGGARLSAPASPAAPAPRRSLRKSGSAPEAPAQPDTPALRRPITLKKIIPQTSEASTPTFRKTIALKKIASQSTETTTPVGQKSVELKKVEPRTPRAVPSPVGTPKTPTHRRSKSSSKKNGVSSKKNGVQPPETPHLEQENSLPLQEKTPLNENSSTPHPAPALGVVGTVLSPVNINARPDLMDARDLEMSRKVRRSYSRFDDLGSGSTSTPNCRRRSFFGFEKLVSGEELEVSPVIRKEPTTQAFVPTAEPWGPNFALPGITMTKEKRRKRKVPEILKSELDEWAAAMNAQFEAAEKFDLLVE